MHERNSESSVWNFTYLSFDTGVLVGTTYYATDS